jgi:dolichyl-phosphate-mannose-protein mannosyltransferase
LVVLGLIAAFSTGARVWRLDDPHDPSGGLIFDEKYYVNAARVMLHLGVPCNGSTCDPYSTIAGGTDPNSEHPPLGKAIIALGMKLFGDNPWGWRVFPVIFGTLALFAIFWLIRSAGGGAWLATGAAALMAADNLFMVHGRIATLDIFVVVFMLAAVALYLRGHPLLSGITLGVGACTKLVAPDALLIIILIEGLRVVAGREWQGDGGWRVPARRLVPLMWCAFSAVLVYLSVLQVLDMAFSPFHDPADSCRGSGTTFSNSFIHTLFMECYASKITSPSGPSGIASYPWQWLLNQESINYYTRSITVSANGQVTSTHPVVAFQGLMNPAIILLALPALALCVGTMLRERDDVSVLVVAWFAGSYLPFVGAAWLQHRTSYLYYMVIVLPAVYIAVARMFSSRWLPRSVLAGYVVILGYEFWALYPFRTWT